MQASSDPEDCRQAASLVASLSSTLTSASIAVLSVGAVLTTYVAGKYKDLIPFYVLMALAGGALVRSLWHSGIGVYEIAVKGFGGDWQIKTRQQAFNKQARSMLFGMAFLFVGAYVGLSATPSETGTTQSTQVIQKLRNEIGDDKHKIANLLHRQTLTMASDERLAKRIGTLERRILRFKKEALLGDY